MLHDGPARLVSQRGRVREQLVQLTPECDRAVLEPDALRAENEELRARVAKYGYTIKTYHMPPYRKTITQKEINTRKERKNPTGRRKACRPAGRRAIPYPCGGASPETVPAIW